MGREGARVPVIPQQPRANQNSSLQLQRLSAGFLPSIFFQVLEVL